MDEIQHHHSQLFTVRVWQVESADGSSEWRGKLQHVPSGEIRYFRGWAALIPLMLDMLRRHPSPSLPTEDKASKRPSGASEETYR